MTLELSAPSTTGPRTTYPGLVGVELRRTWWRRLSKVVLVAAVLLTGVSLYGAYESTSPSNLAQQLDAYRQTVAQFPQMLKDCEQAQAQARESGDPNADFGCSQLKTPTPSDFGLQTPEAGALTVSLTTANAYLYAFLAFVLGTSLIGAEFSSGSMGTWLTFEPRRLRAASTKLLAAGLAGAAIAAVGLAVTTAGAWLISRVNQPDPALQLLPSVGPAESVPQALLRCLVVGVIAAMAGVALTLILRNTGAVVAIVLGYGVIVEGVLAQGVGRGRFVPWLPLKNLEAFVQRGSTYYAESCGATGCDYKEMTLTYTHGWVYLLVFGIALVAVALAVFRRRDVS